MSYQITVKLSDHFVALITYHFPPPVRVFRSYDKEKIFAIRPPRGDEINLTAQDAAAFFEGMKDISIPAKTSNVLLLQTEYKAQSIQLYANELEAIQKAVANIPPKQFADVQELQDYCTMIDY